MVDFKKKLAGKKVEKAIDPIKLYEKLDRAHDKGPLRPAQMAILTDWFNENKNQKDVIVKLHTGQGKTLIGLLMLQSKINENKGPAVYLCPDNFLIEQTCEQAKQFGISTCVSDGDLPEEFLNSEKILVTSVQKMFNGLTQFGLNNKSIKIGSLLMDDAHSCSDIIRQACKIRISHKEPAYNALKTLFADDLEQQGVGTFADISNNKRDAVLPIPYWAWINRENDVARILSNFTDQKSIKFAWPLIKNILGHCQCIVSGQAIEIEAYIPPLQSFGSFWNAEHRIFMSATVTDDAFLVKGLQLKPETIINPLIYAKEKWSGEKMIILPSLIHEDLSRSWVVQSFGVPNSKIKFGVVALAPGFEKTKDWEAYGAIVAKPENFGEVLNNLKNGGYGSTVVLANRYDGIDLPDDTCRILIYDGKPFSESLIDIYDETCRPNSEGILMRTIRTVEQGMGRSVRGEKDYSVIIVTGPDITRVVRDKNSRKFLSSQMAAQIEIGLEISESAKQDIGDGVGPSKAFYNLINQCLGRNEDWKDFYVENMDSVKPSGANKKILQEYAAELDAEQLYISGDYSTASDKIQFLLDKGELSREDKAWYMQEMARYNYRSNRPESNRLQLSAHKGNKLLLKPSSGVTVAKLTIVSQGRIERIIDWVSKFDDYGQLEITLTDILSRLSFGVKADKFEQALDELSRSIGFAGERPDKEWKEGPDNLWALDDSHYIIWECKNEVELTRSEINKREAEQMNRSSAWFDKHYVGASVKRIIIHPSNVVESAAAFTHEVEAMRVQELKLFVKKIKEFFKSFETLNFKDLSPKSIQKLLNVHKLSVEDLLQETTKKLKNLK